MNARRCGAHRRDIVRRATERSVRERRPACGPHGCAPDIRASAQSRPQVPSLPTDWRTHACYRPWNQVRLPPSNFLVQWKSLTRCRCTCRRGVTFILQSILFRVVPTALEISLVCGILVRWKAHFRSKLADGVSVDVQVWLGLCSYHTSDHGRVHLVYRSYYCMAVRWFCFLFPPILS